MRTLALLLTAALAAPSASAAGLTNLSFETDLAGWTATGNVQRISPVGGGKNISGQTGFPASDGSWFALLSNAPDRAANGSGPAVNSGADRDGSGANEFDVATLSQSFTMATPFTLDLAWTVATSEFDGFPDAGAADLAEIRLLPAAGAPIPLVQVSLDDNINDGSFIPLGVGDFSGTSWQTSAPTPPASSFIDGTYLGGFQTATSGVLPAGAYTLEFFVGDESDGWVDTGLLVDNLQITAAVPEPASATLLLSLLPAVVLLRRRR